MLCKAGDHWLWVNEPANLKAMIDFKWFFCLFPFLILFYSLSLSLSLTLLSPPSCFLSSLCPCNPDCSGHPFDWCFTTVFHWLQPQSLLLAPRSHCSHVDLSLLISFSYPFLSKPLPTSLFSITSTFSSVSSISSFAPFSSDTHREWCTNIIPHNSNEWLVIILSPQCLSVWLQLSLNSITNGKASFSTPVIPQCCAARRHRAQRDWELMCLPDSHVTHRSLKNTHV